LLLILIDSLGFTGRRRLLHTVKHSTTEAQLDWMHMHLKHHQDGQHESVFLDGQHESVFLMKQTGDARQTKGPIG
jgi:hypothetical protein